MPENWQEGVVWTPNRTIVTACALSAALALAGCGGGDGDEDPESSGEVLLQPAEARGPDPFTDSTALPTPTPSPVPRTPRPAQSERNGPQPLSGGTPGLYGGTRGTGSCDVQRHIDRLTSDPDRAGAFARAAGISRASIPGHLRSLTSVVLRADTQVTNHGYRDGHGRGYQSVLQAGTAVLVDTRGVPRVRCACGNPLTPPAATRGNRGTRGRSWSGYRPAQVVVVAPTAGVITNITIIDVADNAWIERPFGHRGHYRDHVLPRPKPVPPTPVPHPHDSASSAAGASPGAGGRLLTDGSGTPSGGRTSPSDDRTSAEESPADCVIPTVADTPGTGDAARTGAPAGPRRPTGSGPTDCPTATVSASPPAAEPGTSTDSSDPSEKAERAERAEKAGPETVPDTPDLPDGGGLTPADPGGTDSIFGSPTDVFDG